MLSSSTAMLTPTTRATNEIDRAIIIETRLRTYSELLMLTRATDVQILEEPGCGGFEFRFWYFPTFYQDPDSSKTGDKQSLELTRPGSRSITSQGLHGWVGHQIQR